MTIQTALVRLTSTTRVFSIYLGLSLSLVSCSSIQAKQTKVANLTHLIRMKAVAMPSGQLAYQMLKHIAKSKDGKTEDRTSLYSEEASIPGPTIVMT